MLRLNQVIEMPLVVPRNPRNVGFKICGSDKKRNEVSNQKELITYWLNGENPLFSSLKNEAVFCTILSCGCNV